MLQINSLERKFIFQFFISISCSSSSSQKEVEKKGNLNEFHAAKNLEFFIHFLSLRITSSTAQFQRDEFNKIWRHERWEGKRIITMQFPKHRWQWSMFSCELHFIGSLTEHFSCFRCEHKALGIRFLYNGKCCVDKRACSIIEWGKDKNPWGLNWNNALKTFTMQLWGKVLLWTDFLVYFTEFYSFTNS